MAEIESGAKWWIRYVVVPLTAGGGLLATIFSIFPLTPKIGPANENAGELSAPAPTSKTTLPKAGDPAQKPKIESKVAIIVEDNDLDGKESTSEKSIINQTKEQAEHTETVGTKHKAPGHPPSTLEATKTAGIVVSLEETAPLVFDEVPGFENLPWTLKPGVTKKAFYDDSGRSAMQAGLYNALILEDLSFTAFGLTITKAIVEFDKNDQLSYARLYSYGHDSWKGRDEKRRRVFEAMKQHYGLPDKETVFELEWATDGYRINVHEWGNQQVEGQVYFEFGVGVNN